MWLVKDERRKARVESLTLSNPEVRFMGLTTRWTFDSIDNLC
ncbi:MAG: hypothetical protein ACFFDN_44600 [Candidatus Hodarchaeota archaeon]